MPDSSDSKEFACNAGDPGSIFGSGRSPGEGDEYPHQYSCLENSMERGAYQLQSMSSHRVGQAKQLTLLLSSHACYTGLNNCEAGKRKALGPRLWWRCQNSQNPGIQTSEALPASSAQEAAKDAFSATTKPTSQSKVMP